LRDLHRYKATSKHYPRLPIYISSLEFGTPSCKRHSVFWHSTQDIKTLYGVNYPSKFVTIGNAFSYTQPNDFILYQSTNLEQHSYASSLIFILVVSEPIKIDISPVVLLSELPF